MLSAGNASRQGREWGDTWKADKPEDQAEDLRMAAGGYSLLAKIYWALTDGCRCVRVTTVETVSPGTGIPKSQGQEKARILGTTLYHVATRTWKRHRGTLYKQSIRLYFVITFNTGIVLQTSVSLAIHTANTQKRKEQELISSLAGTLQPNKPVPSTLTAFPQDKQT